MTLLKDILKLLQCQVSLSISFRCLSFGVLSDYCTVTRSLFHSLYFSLTFSAAMRVDAAHTDCSQYNDSPLLT